LQRGRVADGTRFYVGGEVEKFAGVRGAPFRSGEQIVGQRNGRYKSGRGHLFTSLRSARSAARWQRIAREQPKWIWEFLRERVRKDGEFAHLRAGDDEWGQEAQGEIVRAIDD